MSWRYMSGRGTGEENGAILILIRKGALQIEFR